MSLKRKQRTTHPKPIPNKKSTQSGKKKQISLFAKFVDQQSGNKDQGSLDVSPAEEEVSKDRDKSREEVSSTRDRRDPSTFVKTPNHGVESEGDLSESNTGQEKYKNLRHDKSEEPYYHKP